MKKTFYNIRSDSFSKALRLALVSDLHAQDYQKVLLLLREVKPDYILFGGDIFEALDGSYAKKNDGVFQLFYDSVRIAPSFYCTGNHEDGSTKAEIKGTMCFRGKGHNYRKEDLDRIYASGVHFLLDSYEIYDGIAFGGLASGLSSDNGEPNVKFLKQFSKLREPKILISHHPEYFPTYIRELPIDITVSGHAHGGQWELFGRGVFAPGQGFFPKYTAGVYENRLIVSRGLKKDIFLPRIFNPRELVVVDINRKTEEKI